MKSTTSFFAVFLLITTFSILINSCAKDCNLGQEDRRELIFAVSTYNYLIKQFNSGGEINIIYSPKKLIEDKAFSEWEKILRDTSSDGKQLPDFLDELLNETLSQTHKPELLGLLPIMVDAIKNKNVCDRCLHSCLIFEKSFLPDQKEQLKIEINGWLANVMRPKLYDEPNSESIMKDDRSDFGESEKILRRYYGANIDTVQDFKLIKQNMESIVLITLDSFLTISKDSTHYVLSSKRLKYRKVLDETGVSLDNPICNNIRFGNQMSAKFIGTGFFVADSIIATASHVFFPMGKDIDFSRVRFVLNFNSASKTRDTTGVIIPIDDVFEPISPKLRDDWYWRGTEDWALVEVKPLAKRERPTPCAHGIQTTICKGSKVYSGGHGLGLSKKFVFDGSVKGYKDGSFYPCNLDMLGGNSGSPIFDANTHNVVGILSRGEWDFSENDANNCLELAHYDSESPVRNEHFQDVIPLIGKLPNRQNIIREDTCLYGSNTPLPATKNPDNVLTCPRNNLTELKKMYAPYVYLSTADFKTFTTFTLVPVGQNETLKLDTLKFENGTVTIRYDVTPGGTLEYARDTQIFSIDSTKDWTIQVEIRRANGSTRVTKILKSNADKTTDIQVNNNLALNCPYFYLTKPSVCDNHFPYVLIPVNDWVFDSDTQPSTNTMGDRTSIVNLKNPSGFKDTVIFDLKVNKCTYQVDTSNSNSFIIEVKELGSQNQELKKKKTIIRDQNADDKPNGIE